MKEQNKLNQNQIIEIKKRAIEFTCKTLGKVNPSQMCYSISYPLSIHLTNNGILNSIKRGSVNEIDHYWISLDYENGIIIDATARQFNPAYEYVHFGQKLAEEKPSDSKAVFKKWSDDLIDNFEAINSFNKSLQPQHRMQILSIEPSIIIGIKAATILITDNKHDAINNEFIGSICQASRNFYCKNPDKLSILDDTGQFLHYCEKREIP